MVGCRRRQVNEGVALVTSSSLCKEVEGAGFPFQIESLEDGVDDAVHTFYVHKAHHRSGSPSHFHEAALDHVGGAQFAPPSARINRARNSLSSPPRKCWKCSLIGIIFANGCRSPFQERLSLVRQSQLTPSRLLHNQRYVTLAGDDLEFYSSAL